MKIKKSNLVLDWHDGIYQKTEWSINGKEIRHYNKYFSTLDNGIILKINDIRRNKTYTCIKVDTNILWDKFEGIYSTFKSSTANYYIRGGRLDWHFLLHDCKRYGHYYLYGRSEVYNKTLSLKEWKRKMEIKLFL